jgi:S-DNA-T family DNA segregation ATPase FtsK/SpoIIIE
MGRRKKGFLPFLKINGKTFFNMIGFLFVLAGFISLLSFINLLNPDGQGRTLKDINAFLIGSFGGLSIFVPFIIILFSGHFFNTKKLKFVKWNVSLGIILMFFGLLGFFQTGEWGQKIIQSLTLDFSPIGAFVILLFCLLIGIVLFLDTSIDVFILFIVQSFKTLIHFFKNHVFRTFFTDKKMVLNKPGSDKQGTFIQDKSAAEKPKIQIPTSTPVPVPVAAKSANDLSIKPVTTSSTWIYPPLSLLADVAQKEADRGDVNKNADIIEKTLDSFGIRARVAEVNFGPTVTQYALEITMGTKLSKITALGNDLALALAAPTGAVRIEAPIPGRSLVGIEIPNKKAEIVTLKRMLSSPVFTNNTDPIAVPLGLDVAGQPQAASVSRMPHVLIAGTTGSGKSVIMNAWITTFLFRTKPDELRMILVDPKRVELAIYNGIPHLLTEVIVEPQLILKALSWTVAEMENRYKEFAKVGVRNLEGYNNLEGVTKKPFILFVIDELADLMIFAPGEAEEMITRIAQMARATGIHLILATQRPSVDVITGLMKANIPTRLAFNVSTMVDSRVIIDTPGAEKLLGKGDMLFMPPDQAKPRRIQGALVTEKEIHEVVKFLKAQVPEVHYTEEITTKEVPIANGRGGMTAGGDNNDPLFKQSVEIISQFDKASASLLQRRLKIGYARAARILDELEAAGFVGPAEGSKPREVVKRGGAGEGTAEGDVIETFTP